MAENKNVVVNETSPAEEKPSFGAKFAGGFKEGFRKFIVKLKRRPMNIAFFVLIVSTIVYLCLLGNLSQLGLSSRYSQKMEGICIFINTLFSILVLLLFMNSFPKREKKPKIVILVLTFAFMAVLIGLDIYLYIDWTGIYATDPGNEVYFELLNKFYFTAVNGALAHMIIVGIAAILTATYPLYGKLINKINTRKEVESTEIKGEIDTED